MIDLINDDDVRDPWPLPFDWADDDVFSFNHGRFIYDEQEWAPQVNGTAIAIYPSTCLGRERVSNDESSDL